MALRGDTVDNIPGAPGIGDKGSVDLIVEFGSVEAVLDRAAEVKRKSYRESLEQNRDAVLLSKELVTIDCHVPLPLDLTAMETQPPDIDACRDALHRARVHVDAARTGAFGVRRRRLNSSKSPPTNKPPRSTPPHARTASPLLLTPQNRSAEQNPTSLQLRRRCRCLMWLKKPKRRPNPALASAPSPARLCVCRSRPSCARSSKTQPCPSACTILNLALHVLCGLDIALRGSVDDTMLLSYALNPTHTTQTLADVAARHNQQAPESLPAAAAAIQALVTDLRAEAERKQRDAGI